MIRHFFSDRSSESGSAQDPQRYLTEQISLATAAARARQVTAKSCKANEALLKARP